MDYTKVINEGEEIEVVASQSKQAYLKNSLLANIIYIILWIGFDIFFVYVITMDGVKEQFWYMTISVIGLNVLRIWTYVFKCLKDFSELKVVYILTDKAVYLYSDGKFKDLKRLAYEDIITLEKSEYYYDGFYVAGKGCTIKIINTPQEAELFTKLANKLQSREGAGI